VVFDVVVVAVVSLIAPVPDAKRTGELIEMFVDASDVEDAGVVDVREMREDTREDLIRDIFEASHVDLYI
jgi:hypothetical protein